MKRALTKLISLALSIVFFFTHVVMASPGGQSIWKERKTNGIQAISQAPQLASINPSLDQIGLIKPSLLNQVQLAPLKLNAARHSFASTELNNLVSAIPPAFANIKTVSDGSGPMRPVLLVQDIHLNPEAQTNIAAVLQTLIDQKKADVIGVEGAFEDFDFNRFRAFSPAIRNKVAKAYLDLNLMGAPSYVGMTSSTPPPLFTGIDDFEHYDANVGNLLDGMETRKELEKFLNQEKASLTNEKKRRFSPVLAAFDADRSAYRSTSIGLGAYLLKLNRYGRPMAPAMNRFLQAYQLEKSMDFKRVEQERSELIQRLASKMDEKTLSTLLARSLEYRDGRIGFGDYYRLLKNICSEHGIELSTYPAMNTYVQYAMLADGINVDRMQENLDDLEQQILNQIKVNPTERELLSRDEKVFLSLKMVRFELTTQEWGKYQRLSPSRIDLSPFEAFYEEADERSHKFVENLLSHPSTSSRVLIAGGFHTPLITQLLKSKNIPFLVIAPKLTKIDKESASAYLGIFSREKTPLDELFQGQKLSINPAVIEVGAGTPAEVADRTARARMAAITAMDDSLVSDLSGVQVTDVQGGVVHEIVDGTPTAVATTPRNGTLDPIPVAGTQIFPEKLTLGQWLKKKTHPFRLWLALQFDPYRLARLDRAERRTNIMQRNMDVDPLTHVANENAFLRALKSAENDPATSILIIDAANFGQVNKTSGNIAGDNMILEVVSAVRQAAADYDINRIFRLGGIKFAILAPTSKTERIKERCVEIFGYKELEGNVVSVYGAVGRTYGAADLELMQTKKAKEFESVKPQDIDHQDIIKFKKPPAIRDPTNNIESPLKSSDTGLFVAIANFLDPETKVELLRAHQRRNILRRKAERDQLTMFGNRTALDRALAAAELDPRLSIIVFDVNNFKEVNRLLGRSKGDLMLTRIAASIRQAAAEYDNERLFSISSDPRADLRSDTTDTPKTFRRGGDEFVVIARTEHAVEIKDRSEEIFGVHNVQGVMISLSGTVGKTFEAADAILQEAKRLRKASTEPSTGMVLPFWLPILTYVAEKFVPKNEAIRWAKATYNSRFFRIGAAPMLELAALPGLSLLFMLFIPVWASIPLGAVLFTISHGLPWWSSRAPPSGFSQTPTQFVYRLGLSTFISSVAFAVMFHFSESISIDVFQPSTLFSILFISGLGHSLSNALELSPVAKETAEWKPLLELPIGIEAPEDAQSALIALVNATPLILGIGDIKGDQLSLTQWAAVSSRASTYLDDYSTRGPQERVKAENVWNQFSSLLRAVITKEGATNLKASSLKGLITESCRLANSKSTNNTPKEVLMYQFLNETTEGEAEMNIRRTLNMAEETHRNEKIAFGFVVQDRKILAALSKTFTVEVGQGLVHFLAWDEELTFEKMKSMSALLLNAQARRKAETIYSYVSFVENAEYRIVLPQGFELPSGFLTETKDLSRVRIYLLLTQSLMAIQIDPYRLDDLKNLTQTILQQA